MIQFTSCIIEYKSIIINEELGEVEISHNNIVGFDLEVRRASLKNIRTTDLYRIINFNERGISFNQRVVKVNCISLSQI